MTEIFVEVRGGVLVESYSNNHDVTVTLIDWDNINETDIPETAGPIPCLPLDSMSEETLAAVGRSPRDN